MRDGNILFYRVLLLHLPAAGELVGVLAEELGDLRVLQSLTGVGDMVLQEVIELFFVGKELQRGCLVLVCFEAVHYIVGPVEVSDVDEVVCQASEEDKEDEGLLWEGGLQNGCSRTILTLVVC